MTSIHTDSIDNSTFGNLTTNYIENYVYSEQEKFLTVLNIYLTPVIIIIGVIGNGLSLVVFTGTSLHHHSLSVYLVGLAVADIFIYKYVKKLHK